MRIYELGMRNEGKKVTEICPPFLKGNISSLPFLKGGSGGLKKGLRTKL